MGVSMRNKSQRDHMILMIIQFVLCLLCCLHPGGLAQQQLLDIY